MLRDWRVEIVGIAEGRMGSEIAKRVASVQGLGLVGSEVEGLRMARSATDFDFDFQVERVVVVK